jgi:hypothetical protein
MIQGNQLPELVRVKALKGFRATADGLFGVVNPGDVVEVTRADFPVLASAGRVVRTDADKVRAPNYIPERKKNGPAKSPELAKLEAIEGVVQGLASTVAALTEALKAQAAKAGK